MPVWNVSACWQQVRMFMKVLPLVLLNQHQCSEWSQTQKGQPCGSTTGCHRLLLVLHVSLYMGLVAFELLAVTPDFSISGFDWTCEKSYRVFQRKSYDGTKHTKIGRHVRRTALPMQQAFNSVSSRQSGVSQPEKPAVEGTQIHRSTFCQACFWLPHVSGIAACEYAGNEWFQSGLHVGITNPHREQIS